MSIAPTGVHTKQHRGPIQSLRSTCARIDIHNGTHLILLASQHIAKFESLDEFDGVDIMLIHLGLRREFCRHKFGHQLQILDGFGHSIVILNPRLYSRHTAQLFLRGIGIIPKRRVLSLLLFVLQVYSLLSDVKDTSPTNPVVL